jgi:hypothetical protein
MFRDSQVAMTPWSRAAVSWRVRPGSPGENHTIVPSWLVTAWMFAPCRLFLPL